MDKKFFLDNLQRALASGVSSSQVAENMRYYQDYIESEIRKGRSEQEVLDQLGDPRLLAKSIIEANKRAGANYGSNREYDEEVAQEVDTEPNDGFDENHKPRSLVLPGWLIMVIVTVLIIVVIGIATSLISILSPFIIVVLVILLIVKLFQKNTK